jgi:hypothetical protein
MRGCATTRAHGSSPWSRNGTLPSRCSRVRSSGIIRPLRGWSIHIIAEWAHVTGELHTTTPGCGTVPITSRNETRGKDMSDIDLAAKLTLINIFNR